MNILTFDIEEWSIEKNEFGDHKEKYAEFDRVLDFILEKLDESKIKATFFCLGKLAIEFPHVVKKIYSEGHEIGSHSNAHKWVNKMTPEEFLNDTRVAVDSLENLIGEKIKSFRAPAFSIGENNKWAFEILTACGIINDASIFPGTRDFGGFPNFIEQEPCIIDYNGCRINEFPIPMYKIPFIGKEIAYSGGGYFRILPGKFIEEEMKKHSYNMCYFHIKDLLTETNKLMTRKEYEDYFKEDGTLLRRIIRYIKSNIGTANCGDKFCKLISQAEFHSLSESLRLLGEPGKIIRI